MEFFKWVFKNIRTLKIGTVTNKIIKNFLYSSATIKIILLNE